MAEHSKQYDRNRWLKTPYAGTEAKDPMRAVDDLLAVYAVTFKQWTDHTGPNGRPAVTVRFNLQDKTYRVAVETLDVPTASATELRKQVLRVIYWTLKPLLENALLFGGPDRLLLPFMEDDSGQTIYDQMQPYLGTERLKAKDLLGFTQRLAALPSPGEGEAGR